MKKLIISFTAIVIAFIFTICSIGAYNNSTIGFGQFVLQASTGLLVVWIAFNTINNTKKER